VEELSSKFKQTNFLNKSAGSTPSDAPANAAAATY